MTKQEQIEEIASYMKSCYAVNCKGCRFLNEKNCSPLFRAEALYNAGYRKYDGDNLMLESKIKVLEATIERIDNEKVKYLESIENLTSGKCCLRCPLVEVGRKETAKEILQMLFEEWHYRHDNHTINENVTLSMLINRICVKYGVEIEEYGFRPKRGLG